MPITVVCQACQAQLKAPDAAAGKRVKCPRCEAPISVGAPPPPVPEPLELEEFDDSPAPPPPPRNAKINGKAKAAAAPAPLPEPEDHDYVGEPETSLPRDLLAQVFAELTQGERLVWACQPSPRVVYLRGIAKLIGGCFFAGLGVLIAGILSRAQGVSLIPLFIGIVFPGFGLLIGILGVLFAKKQAAKTIYALTNRRAIVWKTQYFGAAKVENYDAIAVRGLKRQDNYFVKGAGDIIFRQEKTTTVSVNRRTGHASTSTQITNYGFLYVEASREVEKLVRDTLHIRVRADDILPTPDPTAVVQAQAAVAGRPLGFIAVFGFAAAAVLFVVPAGVGTVFLLSAKPAKEGAFGLPGGIPNELKKKPEPGSPEDWADLLDDVKGTDGFKRSAAAQRLAKMKPDDHHAEVVKALTQGLSESHGREDCAKALAVWAGPEDVPVLIDALKNDSGTVKQSALEALSRLKPAEAAEAVAGLMILGHERDKARATLIAIGPKAEPAVLALLNEENKQLKIDALKILAKIGTSAGLPVVEKIATETKTKDRGMAKEAEDAAKEMRKRK